MIDFITVRDRMNVDGGVFVMQLIWFLIIGMIAGILTGLIMKARVSGVVGDMVVGVLGAYIGGMLFGTISLSPDRLPGSFIAAAAGAVVLLAVVEVMKKL
jgi:uncharacterized membrane protein YeaQ/YmgE (transglycosylase-associated protein family)